MMSRVLHAHRVRPSFVLVALLAAAAIPLVFGSGLINAVGIPQACLHLVRLCTATLARIDAPLHASANLLLGLGLGYAAVRRLVLARRAVHAFRSATIRPAHAGDPVFELSQRLGIHDRLRIICNEVPNPAFTKGIFYPTVYIADALQRSLSSLELEAVLLHERAHVRARHPFRVAAATLAADVFFWLPLLRAQTAAACASFEFEADDRARVVGDLVLASAILKVAEAARGEFVPAVAFANRGVLTERVERLLGTETAPPVRATRGVLLSSAAAIALAWSLGFTASVAHAANGPASGLDCPHAAMHDASHNHQHQ